MHTNWHGATTTYGRCNLMEVRLQSLTSEADVSAVNTIKGPGGFPQSCTDEVRIGEISASTGIRSKTMAGSCE
jgi:hypothetical protein